MTYVYPVVTFINTTPNQPLAGFVSLIDRTSTAVRWIPVRETR